MVYSLLQDYKENSPLIQENLETVARRKQRKLARFIATLTDDWGHKRHALSKIALLHEMVNDIASLSPQSFQSLSQRTLHGIAEACFSGKPLEFVTIASGAVSENTFDLALAQKRVQYFLYDSVCEKLKGMQSLASKEWNYTVLLPLCSSSQNKDVWHENKLYIEDRTNVQVCYPHDFFNSFTQLHSDCQNHTPGIIASKTAAILNHPTIQSHFSVSEQKIRADVRDYALYGLLFEKLNQPIILVDLQRKQYPYQQPCYQLLRTKPLPVLQLHNLVVQSEQELLSVKTGIID